MWSKIVAFFTMLIQFIVSLFGYSLAVPTDPELSLPALDSAYIAELTENETDYLLSLVLPGGALAMTYAAVDYSFAQAELPTVGGIAGEEYCTWKTALVNPYFAATAVEGMIKASPLRSREVSEGFIQWYFSSMNTSQSDYNGLDGTIYDQRVFIDPDNSENVIQISQRELHAAEFSEGETNTYGYDSTDSYGALFLRVLTAYAEAYENLNFLLQHKADIDRVFAAVLATYISSIGLTAARPDYPMCYLMDNCEVYAGLKDAVRLYRLLGDEERSNLASSRAESVKNGIENILYNRFTGHYHAAAGINGKSALEADDNAVNNFYPEGAAQLFPIIFGVIVPESNRAKAVYSDFCSRYAGNMPSVMNWVKLQTGGFPWAVLLRACALMKDYSALTVYLDTLKTEYIEMNHKYPYYNAESGSVLLALSNISY